MDQMFTKKTAVEIMERKKKQCICSIHGLKGKLMMEVKVMACGKCKPIMQSGEGGRGGEVCTERVGQELGLI